MGIRQKHPLWGTWRNMMTRCTNKNSKDYKNYGKRGIIICDRWKIFENFSKDMGEKISGMTLDRIDNNKGYSKENCRWATRLEQNNNKRNSRYIEYNGSTKTLAQWIKSLGLKRSTIEQRYYTYKWDINRCFNQ
jgi:hypothetical protein